MNEEAEVDAIKFNSHSSMRNAVHVERVKWKQSALQEVGIRHSRSLFRNPTAFSSLAYATVCVGAREDLGVPLPDTKQAFRKSSFSTTASDSASAACSFGEWNPQRTYLETGGSLHRETLECTNNELSVLLRASIQSTNLLGGTQRSSPFSARCDLHHSESGIFLSVSSVMFSSTLKLLPLDRNPKPHSSLVEEGRRRSFTSHGSENHYFVAASSRGV